MVASTLTSRSTHRLENRRPRLRCVEDGAQGQVDGPVVREVAHGLGQPLAGVDRADLGPDRQHLTERGGAGCLQRGRAGVEVGRREHGAGPVGRAELLGGHGADHLGQLGQVPLIGAESVHDVDRAADRRRLPAGDLGQLVHDDVGSPGGGHRHQLAGPGHTRLGEQDAGAVPPPLELVAGVVGADPQLGPHLGCWSGRPPTPGTRAGAPPGPGRRRWPPGPRVRPRARPGSAAPSAADGRASGWW